MNKTKIRLKKAQLTMAGIMLGVILCTTGCNEAKKAYKEGVSLMEEEKYQEAAESFLKAIEENEEKAEYYIAYGMACVKNGQNEDAVNAFSKAVQDKDNKIVRENNKQALKGRGIAYYEEHEYELALADFSAALEISEEEDMNKELLELKAATEKQSGDYEAAQDSYKELVALDKKNKSAYLGKADLEMLMEDYDSAVDDYSQVIKLDEHSFDAYFGMYNALMSKGDESGAMETVSKAASLEIKDTEDKYNVAVAYFYKGDYGTAESYLNEVLDEGDANAWYFLGQISQAKPDYDTAISQYEQYIAANKNLSSAMVYNQLAGCHMEKENYVPALSYILKGLEMKDKASEQSLTYNAVIVYEKLGEFKKAKKYATEYCKAWPGDEEMEKELAFIETRIGSKNK